MVSLTEWGQRYFDFSEIEWSHCIVGFSALLSVTPSTSPKSECECYYRDFLV